MSREILGLNTDAVDSILLGDASFFVQKRPLKAAPMFRTRNSYKPVQGGSLGGEISFEPNRNVSMLGQPVLRFNIAAVTGTGGTAEFADWFPLILAKKIKVTNGSNTLFEISGEQIFNEMVLFNRSDDSMASLLYGDLDQATRQANAAAGLQVDIPIPTPFSRSLSSYLPYFVRAIRTPLRFDITTASLEEIASVPGGSAVAGGALSGVSLDFDVIHLTPDEMDEVLAERDSNNGELETDGYARLICMWNTQAALNMTSSTDVQDLSLNSIRHATKFLSFYAIANSKRPSTGVGNTIDYFGFDALSTYKLSGIGKDIVPTTTDRYSRLYENNKLFPWSPSKYMYQISWSMQPVAPNSQTGYLHLNAVSDLILHPALASAAASKCIVHEYFHNIYTLLPTGDLIMLYA